MGLEQEFIVVELSDQSKRQSDHQRRWRRQHSQHTRFDPGHIDVAKARVSDDPSRYEAALSTSWVRNVNWPSWSIGHKSNSPAIGIDRDPPLLAEVRTRPSPDINGAIAELRQARSAVSAALWRAPGLLEHRFVPIALGMLPLREYGQRQHDYLLRYCYERQAALQVNVELWPHEVPNGTELAQVINNKLAEVLLVGQSFPVGKGVSSTVAGSARVRNILGSTESQALNTRLKQGVGFSSRLEIKVCDSVANLADVATVARMCRAVVERAAHDLNRGIEQTEEISLWEVATGRLPSKERARVLSMFANNHQTELTAAGDFEATTKRLQWIAVHGSEADANRRALDRGGMAELLSTVAAHTRSGTRPVERESCVSLL